MIIWDPCRKTCCGSSVQKRMRVCVGLLTINSTTCELVWALGQTLKKEHATFMIFQIFELEIYQQEVTNELLINNPFNLKRFSFQLGTIHLVVLKTALPALSR